MVRTRGRELTLFYALPQEVHTCSATAAAQLQSFPAHIHSPWHHTPLPKSSHSQHTPAPRTFARFRASPSRASPEHLPRTPCGFPEHLLHNPRASSAHLPCVFYTFPRASPAPLPRISRVSSAHTPVHLLRIKGAPLAQATPARTRTHTFAPSHDPHDLPLSQLLPHWLPRRRHAHSQPWRPGPRAVLLSHP